MKPSIPLATILVAAALPISAQENAAPPAAEAPAAGTTEAPAPAPMTMEERKRSINEMEAHILERQERASALSDDIKRLDERLESQIQKIVTKLEKVKDSTSSQVRVAQTKENAIEGLKRTIDYYVRKRDDLVQALRSGNSKLPQETLKSDLKVFDERINKRVEQIIGIAESFTEHKELSKYIRTGNRNRGWGRGGSSVRINEQWLFNRKSVRHTDKQTADIAKAIEDALGRLDRRSATLTENLKSTKLTPQQKEILEEELTHNEKMFNDRLAQLEKIDANSGGAATQSIDRNQAFTIQKSIEDSTSDLRADFFSIFEKYDQLNKQRELINAMEVNLAARKKWLEENAPD